MFNSIVPLLRDIAPHRLVQRRHARFKINALNISRDTVERCGGILSTLKCIDECRYDLWPQQLRETQLPWTLVDVGANHGQFLRHALLLTNPSNVIAFEPQPECKRDIEDAFSKHHNARAVTAAVGDQAGNTTLHITARSDFASILIPEDDVLRANYGEDASRITSEIQVPVVTLDQALKNEGRIGLLKLDVQGVEASVLRGASRVLSRTDAVLVEINYVPHYKGASSFSEVHEVLTKAGFVLHGVSEPHFHLAQPLWADGVYERPMPPPNGGE